MVYAEHICKLGLPKPEITIVQMRKLVESMMVEKIDGSPSTYNARISKVQQILYSQEEEAFRNSPKSKAPSLLKVVCINRVKQKSESISEIAVLIRDVIAHIEKNIPRVRLLVIAFLSPPHRYDTPNTAAYVVGLMENCIYLKDDKLSLDRSKLVQAIFNDLDKLGPMYHYVVSEASEIKFLSEKMVLALLTAFLAAHDKEHIRLQQVCLALFPKNIDILWTLFKKYAIANSYEEWKERFETLATDAGETIDPHVHQIFRNKSDEHVNLFLKIILPVFSLSHWAGAVSLSMALINLNREVSSRLSTQLVQESCGTVLKLLVKYNILMLKGAHIPKFAQEISEKMRETQRTASNLPQITAGSNAAEMI